jgi:hypothetical protein
MCLPCCIIWILIMSSERKRARKSIRLEGFDYSQSGLYFITICTNNHACLLGDVVDDTMVLNDAGVMIEVRWEQILRNLKMLSWITAL